ncbi:MAG: metallopeptidase family protein [Nibricoccus sp.]
MSIEELIKRAQRVVSQVRQKLPQEVRALAEKLPVMYLDWPDEALLGDDFDEDILGLFVGEPYGLRGGTENPVPAQIFLFLENIYDEAEGNTRRFDEEVKLTYLHELGHYLGWDEDEVEARGL